MFKIISKVGQYFKVDHLLYIRTAVYVAQSHIFRKIYGIEKRFKTKKIFDSKVPYLVNAVGIRILGIRLFIIRIYV